MPRSRGRIPARRLAAQRAAASRNWRFWTMGPTVSTTGAPPHHPRAKANSPLSRAARESNGESRREAPFRQRRGLASAPSRRPALSIIKALKADPAKFDGQSFLGRAAQRLPRGFRHSWTAGNALVWWGVPSLPRGGGDREREREKDTNL